ncbi:MAG: PASTA domain-containing protein, partial [Eubacterium sp.]|nr:PASTA domain-containing protein [Eubacterium sp.]
YDEVIANKEYNFNFVSEFEKTSDYEPGTIIAQNPVAEERVMAGTTVTLTVAQPIEDMLVPNIVGLTQERAEQRLSQDGLTNIKIAKVDSDSVEEGNVIYTEPRINAYVSKDTLITVYISTGPTTTTIESIKMPNVVNLSKDDAVSFLKKTGFNNLYFKTEESPKPKDTVIAQSETEGNSLKEDTKITLTVSTGTTTTTTATYKVMVNVLLPAVYGANGYYVSDNVIIYVDGAQYSSSKESLNGSIASFPIEAKADSKIEIEVLISSFNETQKSIINVDKNNKDVMFDFSSYSSNKGQGDAQ